MKPFKGLALIAAFVAAIVCANPAAAGTAKEINDATNATLQSFDKQYPTTGRELARKAAGILVFPSVYKAGFGIGGSYGEGVLIVRGEPAGYYNIVSASFGLQLGAHSLPVGNLDLPATILLGHSLQPWAGCRRGCLRL